MSKFVLKLINFRCFSTVKPKTKSTARFPTHKYRLNAYFNQYPHLTSIKHLIPEEYFLLKRKTSPENLYLTDIEIARKIVLYALPLHEDQLICETNAGLGLITKELLERGINLVRIYESCPKFNKILLGLHNESYPGRIELFKKDIFLLHRYDYFDQTDNGDRVEQLLRAVPEKQWYDNPRMTIFGTMSNFNFIRFLIKSLILRKDFILKGRIQLFAIMRPRDYTILTAEPPLNFHTYQRWSVLFHLFFDWQLLDKYPREAFLPWESKRSTRFPHYPNKVDPDFMYLLKINFKKDLPVTMEHLLPLFSFVSQFFGRGGNKVVPTLEKWVPGSGMDAIFPTIKHENYFKNLNIFTQFGELTPKQILFIFYEMINHPLYDKSNFKTMIENQLLKTETIDPALDEQLRKNVVEDADNET